MTTCPVCGMMVDEDNAPSSEYKGKEYYFMNQTMKTMFDENPEKYLGKKQAQSQH